MSALLCFIIRGYQRFVSPLIHRLPGTGCRFLPSCSQYCLEALQQHGLRRGLWLGTQRLLRCHPWGGFGFDPVPSRKEPCQHPH